jgi:flagellar protein FlaG
METKISSLGRNLATDGHLSLNSSPASLKSRTEKPVADAKHVIQDITKSIAQVKEDAERMERVSDLVVGQKIRFSVNQELGQIVAAIVDPQTNQVIKEIPSVEQQKIRMKLRKTTGLLFDMTV